MRRFGIIFTVCTLFLGGCPTEEIGDPEYAPQFAMPSLPDWDCPEGWTTTPGFVDAAGNEDVPEGLTQFNRCQPPASWAEATGPLQLQSWTCPTGWVAEQHSKLLDAAGNPFSWCRPPREARMFAAGDNPDGSDYLSPIPEGADASDYEVCDAAQAMMPALWATGCVHIGDDCPAGSFPTIPASVTGTRVYVLAGSSGGTGTDASPFATLNEAVAAASAGDVIVVGAGTYDERVVVDKALTIWGACVERVKLMDTTSTIHQGALTVRAALTLKNLEINSTGQAIVQDPATDIDGLQAEGIFVHHATHRSVYIQRGSASLRDSLIFMLDDPPGSFYRRGIQAEATAGVAATIEVERVVIEQASSGIISYGTGALVTVADLLVRSTTGEDTYGQALAAWEGGQLEAVRVHADHTIWGVVAYGGAASMELEDLVFTNPAPAPRGTLQDESRGLYCAVSATLTVSRALVEGAIAGGISFYDASGELEDVVITGTQKLNGAGYGSGLRLSDGATVTARGLVIDQGQSRGISMDDGAQLTATDVASIDNVNTGTTGTMATGITMGTQCSATIERGLFADNQNEGIIADTAPSAIHLIDTVVRNTLLGETGNNGLGILLLSGAEATLERVVVDNNIWAGIVADTDCSVDATDLVVSNTQPQDDTGGGLGVLVVRGSRASIVRGQITDNQFAGILSEGEEGALPGPIVNLQLTDVLVSDTSVDASWGSDGVGISVVRGQVGRFTNLLLRRNHAVGLIVQSDSAVSGSTIVITETRAASSMEGPGRYGWGLAVQGRSTFLGEQILLDNNQDSAAVFYDCAPSSLTDLLIRGTILGECAGYDPADPGYCLADGQEPATRGLALMGPSVLDLINFELSGNGTMGLQVLLGTDENDEPLASGPTLTMTNGGVLDHHAGICIQELPDFDESNLQSNVFFANDVDISYEVMAEPSY